MCSAVVWSTAVYSQSNNQYVCDPNTVVVEIRNTGDIGRKYIKNGAPVVIINNYKKINEKSDLVYIKYKSPDNIDKMGYVLSKNVHSICDKKEIESRNLASAPRMEGWRDAGFGGARKTTGLDHARLRKLYLGSDPPEIVNVIMKIEEDLLKDNEFTIADVEKFMLRFYEEMATMEMRAITRRIIDDNSPGSWGKLLDVYMKSSEEAKKFREIMDMLRNNKLK